ncbi:Latent-Transforming Growth Factor Beta-Binding Protein 2 [Manis pentadactyla]|nr:Latent-Transforming Growth Factor Beta-Binding Protein 2 [Manis pentadactyla]
MAHPSTHRSRPTWGNIKRTSKDGRSRPRLTEWQRKEMTGIKCDGQRRGEKQKSAQKPPLKSRLAKSPWQSNYGLLILP